MSPTKFRSESCRLAGGEWSCCGDSPGPGSLRPETGVSLCFNNVDGASGNVVSGTCCALADANDSPPTHSAAPSHSLATSQPLSPSQFKGRFPSRIVVDMSNP